MNATPNHWSEPTPIHSLCLADPGATRLWLQHEGNEAICQNHKINILCKLGYENRAQFVAHLLGSFAVGTDERASTTRDETEA
jgi:hypothetical protein